MPPNDPARVIEPTMSKDTAYDGYLSPHLDRIREMHEAGCGTREIAEALFNDGARASTSDPNVRPSKLSREHHVKNLRGMVLHTLQRLGLRTRQTRPRREDDLTDFDQPGPWQRHE
jgi:hypothetical protein